MIEEKEIDLDNPIFVYYVNVKGLIHSSVDRLLREAKSAFNYKNVTFWIIPTDGETKIECVYDGRINKRSEELKFLIDEINEKVDILSKSGSFDDFKINIRDWRIKNLLE